VRGSLSVFGVETGAMVLAAEEAARKRVAICYDVLLRIYFCEDVLSVSYIEGEMSSAL